MGKFIHSDILPSKMFLVVNSTLFVLALFLAAARMVIRFYSQRNLHSDDFVLMFACLTLTASQVLLYILGMDNIHWSGGTTFTPGGPQTPTLTIEDLEVYYRRISMIMRMEYSIGILTWTSIFSVKVCFLLFFHQIITRSRRLIVAWKVILGITIISWVLCSSASFISCPYIGQAALKCTQGRGHVRNLAVDFMGFFLDTLSDLLLISLPLMVLWKAKMKCRQKIFLGVFLCLSVCMIIIACVRVLAFNINGTYNAVWGIFWHQAEAAVAIIMVSITAFRSLLGLRSLKAQKKKEMERYWFADRAKLQIRYFKKRREAEAESEVESEQLPSIPGATLTGMRTFLNGNESWDESMEMGKIQKLERESSSAASLQPHENEVNHQISTTTHISDKSEHAKVAAVNFV